MNILSDKEITDLCKALCKGNERAWRRFHNHFSHRLASFIHQIVNDDIDAIADILQDTLCRCVRYIKTFSSEEHFWCWLSCLARSATSDYFRKQVVYKKALSNYVDGIIPSNDLQIYDYLQLLPENPRKLIEAKYLHGYTVREIARKESTSTRKIAHALDSARKSLRKIIRS